jgi:hypothetical protein
MVLLLVWRPHVELRRDFRSLPAIVSASQRRARAAGKEVRMELGMEGKDKITEARRPTASCGE